MNTQIETFVVLLRGINVGGHHKVPMAKLKGLLEKSGFSRVTTLLNSGNLILNAPKDDESQLDDLISTLLNKEFGFEIPTIVLKKDILIKLLAEDPFREEELTKDRRWYVSFLKNPYREKLELPWSSKDGSFRIISNHGKVICSVLDLAISDSPKAMGALERIFGKDITTRNWKTLIRIGSKLVAE